MRHSRRGSVFIVVILSFAMLAGPLPSRSRGINVSWPKWNLHFDADSPLRAAGSVISDIPQVLNAVPQAIAAAGISALSLIDSAFSAPAQAATGPQPGEQTDRRTRDSATYLNLDGTYTALLQQNLHYQDDSGQWALTDPTFRHVGSEWIADRSSMIVRATSSRLYVTDHASGKGVSWPLPSSASVSGNQATFSGPFGLQWTYTVGLEGVKLAGNVPARVGQRTYSFPYQLVAGAGSLTLASDGSLRSDKFMLPPPVVIGADGVIYDVGAWRATTSAVSFDFDDTALPAAAFPYELDPTTTAIDVYRDAWISGSSSSYPPQAGTGTNSTGDYIEAGRSKLGTNSYGVNVCIVRWLTDALPLNAVISAASMKFWVKDAPENTNNLTLRGEWHDWSSVSTAEWTGDYLPSDAFIGPAISTLNYSTGGTLTTVTLSNPSQNIAVGSGASAGIRLKLSQLGGNIAPTGVNRLFIMSSEAGKPPQLSVTYDLDTVAPTGALTAPSSEATVSGTTTFTSTPTDPSPSSGIKQVDFYATTAGFKKLVATDTSSSGGWSSSVDTRIIPEGRAVVSAEYTDNGGNVSCCSPGASTSVMVNNAGPAPDPWMQTDAADGVSIAGHDAQIVLSTGQLVAGVQDDSIPGHGFDAVFNRTYNSGSSSITTAGPGWRTSLDDQVAPSYDGSVLYVDDAGREIRYAPTTSAGLDASFYNNTTLTGSPALTRTDAQGNFDWGTSSPGAGVNADGWSAKWKGLVSVPTAGSWTFYATTDDGVRVLVDGAYVLNKWVNQTATETSGAITLGAGSHEIEMQYYDSTGTASASLSWAGPGVSKQLIPAANLFRITGFTTPAGYYTSLARNSDATYTLTDKDQSTIHFNANGRVDVITDTNANTIKVTYDSSSRPTYVCVDASTCNSSTYKISLAYDGSGRLQTVHDNYPRSWTYGYDSSGRLQTVTDPLTNATTYAYSGTSSRLASITDAESGQGAIGYDGSNRVITVKDPNAVALSGPATTYAYGTNVTVTSAQANSTNPAGSGTVYSLGSSGEGLSVTDPLGRLEQFSAYDSNHNSQTYVDQLTRTTTYTFDSRGNMLTKDPPVVPATVYTYDTQNNLRTVTDGLGKQTVYDYENATNNLITITDANLDVTTYHYNGYGEKDYEIDPRGNEVGKIPSDYKTTFSFDANGNLSTVVDALGNKSGGVPTEHTTTYVSDVTGNLTQVTDAVGDITQNVYDAVGNLKEVDNAVGTSDFNKTTYDYDKVGRQIDSYSPMAYVAGNTPADYKSRTTYLANGLAKEEYDPQNNKSTSAYDWDGNLVTGTDPRLNSSASEYDLAGQLLKDTAPDGGVTTYAYWGDGALKTATDPKGTTSYFYDAHGRQTEVDGARLDAQGNVLKTLYTYDDADHLKTTVTPAGNVPGALTGSYRTENFYDDAGNLDHVTAPSGTTSYAYDAAGNQTQITDPLGAKKKFFYNEAGLEFERRVTGSSLQTASATIDQNGANSSTSAFATAQAGNITASVDWPKMPTLDHQTPTGTLTSLATQNYNVKAPGDSLLQGALTWQQGQTTDSDSITSSLAGGGSTSRVVNVTSTHTAITGSVDWTTFGKAFTTLAATVSPPGAPSASRAITVAGPGTITSSMTWQNSSSSTLTPATHMHLEIFDPSGTRVAQSSSTATQPATLSYAVTSLSSPATYTVKAVGDDLGANLTLNGTTPTYADVNLQLFSPADATNPVAQDVSTTARPASVTWTPTVTGNYTFKVISVADSVPSYTLSASYPVLKYPQVTYQLLSPSNTVLETLTSSDGATGLALGPYLANDPGGLYKVAIVNGSNWSAGYSATTDATVVRPVVRTGSLAGSATVSQNITSDGTGYFRADLSWSPASADVQAKIYNPSGTLVGTSPSAGGGAAGNGTVTVANAVAGIYRIDVVNNSASAVSSYTLTARPPTAAYPDLDLQLLDGAGNVVSQPSDHSVRPEVIDYANAAIGNYSLKVTAPRGYGTFNLRYNIPTEQVTSSTHYNNGDLKDEITSAGTTHFTYKPTGALGSATLPDSTRTYAYFADGSQNTITDPTGTKSLTYDTAGRLATESKSGVTTTYHYDAASNQDSITRASNTVTLGYDSVNRLQTHVASTSSQFAYADKLNPTQLTNGSGEIDAMTFNEESRPSTLTLKNSSTSSARLALAYIYDAEGRLTKVSDQTGAPVDLATYSYDGSGRLTSESVKVGAGTQSMTYGYDSEGNRTSVSGPAGTTTPNYNAAGQLTSVVDGSGKTIYIYDSRGNLVAKAAPSGTTSYTWSSDDLLTGVTPPSGSAVTFSYDAEGERVSKGVASATTSSARESRRLVSETTSSSTTTYTYDIDGSPLTITLPGGATYNYHYDRGGSTMQLTDSAHGISASYVYDAWGNVLDAQGTSALIDANPFTYRGELGVRWDKEIGLYNMGVRYYDPVVGRFLSRDPAAAEDATGTYVYADDNPVTKSDPSGMYPLDPDPYKEPATHSSSGKCAQRSKGLLRLPWSCKRKQPIHICKNGCGNFFHEGGHKRVDEYAIDFGLHSEAVLAVTAGRVVCAGLGGYTNGCQTKSRDQWTRVNGYGYRIIVRNADGSESLYAHLSRAASGIRAGSSIRQGQTVGMSGDSTQNYAPGQPRGHSGEPHLHFSMRTGAGAHKVPVPMSTGNHGVIRTEAAWRSNYNRPDGYYLRSNQPR